MNALDPSRQYSAQLSTAKKHGPPSSPPTIVQTPNDTEGEIVDLGWKDLNNTLSTPTRRRRKGKSNQLANSKAPSTPQEDTSQRLAIATVCYRLLFSSFSSIVELTSTSQRRLIGNCSLQSSPHVWSGTLHSRMHCSR